ncbi:four-carbon acid sugar kinase family protein [Amphibacillus sp. Q70]|uniref:four-carbon acid sugar kinase family protein n=1 Tax=Amphibacillus sp. Q70 TaxID=3453416 RepID=UPI003F84220C
MSKLKKVKKDFKQQIEKRMFKTIILDDDPTGSQTVRDVYVYTKYDLKTIRKAFQSSESAFFILTNSRSLTQKETIQLHKDIMKTIEYISQELSIQYQLISRSDSTLRQHYPIESNTINEYASQPYECEIIIPSLTSAGRVTINDIHYIIENNHMLEINKTDYSKDKSFGYRNSNLKKWIEEKTDGIYSASKVISITLDEIRSFQKEVILSKIKDAHNFQKIIVNIETEEDMIIFCSILEPLVTKKKILFRTAASFVKIFIGCFDSSLLKLETLYKKYSSIDTGGLIMIGSHVKRTTQQLETLTKQMNNLEIIEFNQHLALEDRLESESLRVIHLVENAILKGRTTVVHTRRDRVDLENKDGQAQLDLTQKISNHFMQIVLDLSVKPSFLIAKGGITSSDIATKALKIDRALVIGQVINCVPVWIPDEGKFKNTPYIIFPGNIGGDKDLYILTKKLIGGQLNV